MKPSFKTTTLIAAIGMSIAVGYSLIVQFINNFTGIDLYVHPVRMQCFWRLYDCIWWASVTIFFWGLFRYPNQLPLRSKQSKTFGIIALISIALLFVIRLWIINYDDPQWVRYLHFIVRSLAHIGCPIVLWWLFAKSDTRQTPNVMRYIAIITSVIGVIAFLYEVCTDIAWWYDFHLWSYATFFTMTPYYNVLYVAAASCILIGMYGKELWGDCVTTDCKTNKRLKRIYVAGWSLLGGFALNAILLVSVSCSHIMQDWLVATITILFFILLVVAGIYLLIACRALQKAYDVIQEQQKQLEQ